MLNDQDKKLILDIGRRIRQLRKRQKLSIAQVAFEIGTSESYVQRIEKGNVNPGIVTLNRLAIVLNTTLAKIVAD